MLALLSWSMALMTCAVSFLLYSRCKNEGFSLVKSLSISGVVLSATNDDGGKNVGKLDSLVAVATTVGI